MNENNLPDDSDEDFVKELASYFARFYSCILDCILFVLFTLILFMIVLGILAAFPFDNILMKIEYFLQLVVEYPFILTLIVLFLFTLLNGWTLYESNQTLGKKLTNTKIVRSDGEPIPFLHVLILRYYIGIGFGILFVLGYNPYLGFLYLMMDVLCIFTSSGQCIHDGIADTTVIYTVNKPSFSLKNFEDFRNPFESQ